MGEWPLAFGATGSITSKLWDPSGRCEGPCVMEAETKESCKACAVGTLSPPWSVCILKDPSGVAAGVFSSFSGGKMIAEYLLEIERRRSELWDIGRDRG